jgi:hypothetical protein
MRPGGATMTLVLARARRRPGRWLLTALGVALATAFAGAIAAESTIAGDQAARSSLSGLSAVGSAVRVTWQGVVTPAVERQAHLLLESLGLGAQAEVVLLNPVRLSGIVVRPAAIAPLGRWIGNGSATLPGGCRAGSCPALLAGGRLPGTAARPLTAAGVRVPIVGQTRLISAAPLGFTPGQPSNQPPILVTGDPAGLEALAGLGGVYRTHSWLAPLATAQLHSWELKATEQRLQQAQAALLSSASSFSLTAPFGALDAARAQADAAPRRLLLAGGGALAALALFVVLAVGGLRRDVDGELRRLQAAGARTGQRLTFVVQEAALLCGVALLLGAVLAVTTAVVLADTARVPVGGVLAHSLISPIGAGALLAGWICTTALVAILLLARGGWIGDLLAVAAAAALALALFRGAGANDPLPVLLAPLCCLAAGVLVFRGAAIVLQGGERLARRGPVLARLAFVGLARAPAAPSLAIAFIAVSIGLGAFALAYRATLVRSASDQAADRVPLDAIVSAGPDFTPPLEVAPPSRWEAIAQGSVSPVRRTDASYVSGGSSVTVPALGVPSGTLARLHGWRSSDGSAPLAVLGRRLAPSGPVRVPGPVLPAGARTLSLRASSPGIGVTVTADVRDGGGAIDRVVLGAAGAHGRLLHARLRGAGPAELDGIELSEPTGLEATNGHQNGENVAAATQFAGAVTLGPLAVANGSGHRVAGVPIAGWRAVGAASLLAPGTPGTPGTPGSSGAVVRFTTSGMVGLLRPAQPSDGRPVPVLVDPQTAMIAGRTRRLALTVDGLPVDAQVVGVLQRFPTIPDDAAGFVVANEPTLAAALDAQAPGQGRADELWISTAHPERLRTTLDQGPFAQLSSSFRADAEHQLRAAPAARAVLGTLIAATALSGALAVVGLLVALLGATRDERIERDLIAQGVGPRGVRGELRLRLMLAGVLGVLVGLGIGVLLTRLAVAAVRAAGTVAIPRPPLVTVAPWSQLALWGLGALGAFAVATWLATRSLLTTTSP